MDDVLTYTDIASDWNLWAEYVDPSATMTEAEFDALPIEEKIAIQTACFGEESVTPDLLAALEGLVSWCGMLGLVELGNVCPECDRVLDTNYCPTCEGGNV